MGPAEVSSGGQLQRNGSVAMVPGRSGDQWCAFCPHNCLGHLQFKDMQVNWQIAFRHSLADSSMICLVSLPDAASADLHDGVFATTVVRVVQIVHTEPNMLIGVAPVGGPQVMADDHVDLPLVIIVEGQHRSEFERLEGNEVLDEPQPNTGDIVEVGIHSDNDVAAVL